VPISDDVIIESLRNIYNKNFNPGKEIEPEMFRAVWKELDKATSEGFGIPSAEDPDRDFFNALRHNNAVFSAFKVHRMQNDMAAQLLDEKGNLKPFKQWSNDVQPIASHQCRTWLRTEYDTAVMRAHQAADWQRFERYKDILPNLEWMPTTSVHPDEEHSSYVGTILPVDDPFWSEHHPLDHWGCKCSLQQTDAPVTDRPDITDMPDPGLDNNPGKDAKLFSDSHPYIANTYKGANKAVDSLVRSIDDETASPDVLYDSGNYTKTEKYGLRLLINRNADATELKENTRCAEVLLSEPENHIVIKGNSNKIGVKNPEYVINGDIADRKGIVSEKGITSAFKKAIKQGCSAVVIDLDMNMKKININRLAQYLYWRNNDFKNNVIGKCYVVFGGKFVVIDKSASSKSDIMGILKKIEP
jgi:hypothetical protein